MKYTTHESCAARIQDALARRTGDFLHFMRGGTSHEGSGQFCEHCDCDITQLDKEGRRLCEAHHPFWEDLGSLQEYGLSVGFEEDQAGLLYLRFHLSWGGPSDEVRFYQDRTIYVFQDWWDGAEVDVTHLTWAEWLREEFAELYSDERCPLV